MSKELKTKNNFFASFTLKEFVAFIIALAFIAFGLTLLVLGLIDDYTNIYGSVLETPNTSMKTMMGGIGFTWFGLMVVALGVIILAFSLSLASKGEDRIKDKEARRKMRLESLNKEEQVVVESTISSIPTSEESKEN